MKETPQFFFGRVYRKLTLKKRRKFSINQNNGALLRIAKLKTKNFISLKSLRLIYGIEEINKLLNTNFKKKIFCLKSIKIIL